MARPDARQRASVPARARPDAGLHGRAGGGRPGRDAVRDAAGGQGRGESRPARPRRPDHRPLGPGRLVRIPRLLHAQHRKGDRAQPRALLAFAVGAAGVPQLFARPAGHGHLPPGQPRIHLEGCASPRRGRSQGRDPRHFDGHRLAHDDGQRARRARLGSRRHRGRGRDARPACVPRDANRGRRALPRSAARRVDRNRPRADAHGDAAQARCGGEVRRVLRRWSIEPFGSRPRHDEQHVPRVRGDVGAVSGRRADAALPGDHGTQPRADRPGRELQQRAGPLPQGRRRHPEVHRAARARPDKGRAQPRRPQAAAGPRAAAQSVGELHLRIRQQPQTEPRRDLAAHRGRRPRRRTHGGRGGRRTDRTARERLRGDRGHHQLHKHIEPVGHGRRGIAGEKRGGTRSHRPSICQDEPRPGFACGDRLPQHGRLDGTAREAGLLPRRLRLHHVHRQLRPARESRGRGGGDEREPQRGRRPFRQPQLRVAHPPPGQGQLPGVATARRCVCARGHSEHRPHKGPHRSHE